MAIERKNDPLGVFVRSSDHENYRNAAKVAGMTKSAWIVAILNAECARHNFRIKPEGGELEPEKSHDEIAKEMRQFLPAPVLAKMEAEEAAKVAPAKEERESAKGLFWKGEE